jgi:hypothetical protein
VLSLLLYWCMVHYYAAPLFFQVNIQKCIWLFLLRLLHAMVLLAWHCFG